MMAWCLFSEWPTLHCFGLEVCAFLKLKSFSYCVFQLALSMFFQEAAIPNCRNCNGNLPNTHYPVSCTVCCNVDVFLHVEKWHHPDHAWEMCSAHYDLKDFTVILLRILCEGSNTEPFYKMELKSGLIIWLWFVWRYIYPVVMKWKGHGAWQFVDTVTPSDMGGGSHKLHNYSCKISLL